MTLKQNMHPPQTPMSASKRPRNESVRIVSQSAPKELWPPFAKYIIFSPPKPGNLFLKRHQRLKLTSMITGMLPMDLNHAERADIILSLLGPFLRDKDAIKDVVGICKRMDEEPATTIYYDVKLKEHRYANGRVPVCVQNVQHFEKVNRRKRRSLEEYLYHCVQTKRTMPATTRINTFMMSSEKNARDFFST